MPELSHGDQGLRVSQAPVRPSEGRFAPPLGAANAVSVGVVQAPARPSEGALRPPLGAANAVSVGVVTLVNPFSRVATFTHSLAGHSRPNSGRTSMSSSPFRRRCAPLIA